MDINNINTRINEKEEQIKQLNGKIDAAESGDTVQNDITLIAWRAERLEIQMQLTTLYSQLNTPSIPTISAVVAQPVIQPQAQVQYGQHIYQQTQPNQFGNIQMQPQQQMQSQMQYAQQM